MNTAFAHSIQFLAVLDAGGVVLDVNRTALELGGMAAPEAVGRAFWETGWWQDLPEERVTLRAAVAAAAAGDFVRHEVELADGSGAAHALDLSLTPVRQAGRVALIIAEGRDVTERRRAERALRVSEAKFAGIISIASDAIISIDEKSEITLFNSGAEAIFGYSAAEVIGQRLDILLPERARAIHVDHLRNFAAAPVAARRMGERQEIMGLRRDGTEFPAEASISKLDLFGSLIFTVVLRDISERKRIERSQRFLAQAGAILVSSLDYEATLSSVARLTVPDLADWCVIYMREEDGTVRKLEAAHADPLKRELIARLLHFPLDSRRPHPALAVLETGSTEVRDLVDDAFLRAISRDDQHYGIYRELGMGSFVIVPLVARGETRGAMGFFAARQQRYNADDVTLAEDLARVSALAVDNARLYRNAQVAVQARDDMMAVVSHDLGNPLSAIRIGTSVLLRSLTPEQLGSGGRQHLEFLRQSAQQMESLINDLLDVRRLEAGGVTLDVQQVSLPGTLGDVMEVFRPIAEARSIRLTCELPPTPPPLAADPQRLVQLLSNLLGNALKFTEPGGSVAVEVSRTDDVLLFTVSDTGAGIAAEHLPHVFDRFWQANRQGRRGLGLGLAIARGIVEAHGGRIWAESTVGAGSTFLFTLPAADPPV